MNIVRNPENGKFKYVELTENEYKQLESDDEGICTLCGETQSECEPDARMYPCDSCDAPRSVYAVPELLVMDRVKFV